MTGAARRFFGLALASSFALRSVPVMLRRPQQSRAGLVSDLLAITAPALLAAGLTARAGGRPAVTALVARVAPTQTPALSTLAFALPLATGYAAARLSVARGGPAPQSWRPRRVVPGGPTGQMTLPGLIASQLLVVTFGEQLGWRGYGYPLLRARMSALPASLILGGLWSLWHLPLFSLRGSNQAGSRFAQFAASMTAQVLVMSVLFERSRGNVFPMMLFHTAINVRAFALPFAGPRYSQSLLALNVVSGLVAAACLGRLPAGSCGGAASGPLKALSRPVGRRVHE